MAPVSDSLCATRALQSDTFEYAIAFKSSQRPTRKSLKKHGLYGDRGHMVDDRDIDEHGLALQIGKEILKFSVSPTIKTKKQLPVPPPATNWHRNSALPGSKGDEPSYSAPGRRRNRSRRAN
jgi:hypothetical protein